MRDDHPLIEAAAAGDTDRVRELLAGDPGLVNVRGWMGITPLIAATWRADSAEVVAFLLARGADPLAVRSNGDGALHWAASGSVAELLAAAAGPAGLEARYLFDETPLHVAAEKGHADVVAALLSAGANPDAVSSKGDTPLDLADDVPVALLLAAATTPQWTDRPRTPLHDACRRARRDAQWLPVVDLLLDRGADPGQRDAFGALPAELLGPGAPPLPHEVAVAGEVDGCGARPSDTHASQRPDEAAASGRLDGSGAQSPGPRASQLADKQPATRPLDTPGTRPPNPPQPPDQAATTSHTNGPGTQSPGPRASQHPDEPPATRPLDTPGTRPPSPLRPPTPQPSGEAAAPRPVGGQSADPPGTGASRLFRRELLPDEVAVSRQLEVAIHPDGTQAVTSLFSGAVLARWELSPAVTPVEVVRLGRRTRAWGPNGALVFADRESVWLRDWADLRRVREVPAELLPDDHYATAVLSPDGRHLVVTECETLRLVDLERGAVAGELTGFGDWSIVPRFSPDGRVVAAGNSMQGSWWLTALDVAGGTPRRRWEREDDGLPSGGGSEIVSDVAFSPDGGVVAAWVRPDHGHTREGGYRGLVATARADTGADVWHRPVDDEVTGAHGGVSAAALCYTPDGTRLAVGLDTGVLWLDARTGTPAGHDPVGRVHALAAHPAAGTLAATDHGLRRVAPPPGLS